jgi:hypothetical protein
VICRLSINQLHVTRAVTKDALTETPASSAWVSAAFIVVFSTAIGDEPIAVPVRKPRRRRYGRS